ncbi:MAG: hypothetical protein HY819_10080 [Acidobacteria bacterium]|nr:hypothetical protein [Acidobacteriota bacterium]
MLKLRSKSIVIIFFLALIQLACAQGPTDEETKLLITTKLKQELPSTWIVGTKVEGFLGNIVSNTVKSANVEVESIEIKQRGDFNETEKYWPIKAQVKGTFQRQVVGNTVDNKITFDREGNFRFSKDDYDNWKVAIVE